MIEREIGDFDLVFVPHEGRIAEVARGQLTRDEIAVLEFVNGKTPVKDIIRALRLGSFDVSKILFRLLRAKFDPKARWRPSVGVGKPARRANRCSSPGPPPPDRRQGDRKDAEGRLFSESPLLRSAAGEGRGEGRPCERSTCGRYNRPKLFVAVSTTSRSFAACTSGVMSLPCTVLENPHWGDSASCSIGT